ncbi:MFS transporter permease [Endozoicomonas montiporae]|uniref:MFS transporter permease n=2 Tax=Endozoicomonas montiporae TaxID=1027273 RepID=A0A081N8C6_9GAMM|nr:DUF2798 domain-containing protein [Endozoicomonas montiporae]AMO55411.1 hypothetical protein EZMO1_1218 [Endozoicomonas montiporae CL-33]KEQ14699.1 MFS transporter permease [Endozoicomonas montiporae]
MNRKEFLINCFLSSVFMTLMMSGVISGTKVGFGSAWLGYWTESFLFAWPLALIFNMTIVPQVRGLSIWLANIGRSK